MQNISREGLELLAMQTCHTVTGEPLFPHQLCQLIEKDLLKLVTVAEFVTDLCINELERRNMLETCEDCGAPKVPYISDYSVPTIFNREDGEEQPSGQPTAH